MADDGGRGPWDTPGGGNNGNGSGNGSGGGNGGNPWQPPEQGGPGNGPKPGKVTSLDELLKKRRAGGGGGNGGAWNKFPKGGDGKSAWAIGIALLVALWLVWTSFHRLEPAQSGVITTFGKYSGTVGPGISLTFPYPIQNLTKVDTGEVRTVTIGSVDSNSENLIITRDENVIDMAYNVRWQVADPERYLFQLADPDDTVREVAESAMRASIANFDLIQAIGPGRSEIQADVRDRMEVILNEYRAGISVQSIDIQQAAAPSEVSESFRRVNAAKQQAESNRNEARKYARQVTELALGETAEFDKIYVQYSAAPEVTKRRIYYETMEQVLGQTDKTIVETGNVTPYLPLPEIRKRSGQTATPAAAPAATASATSQANKEAAQ